MPTVNQLIRKPRGEKPKRNKVPALTNCPQKRGVCILNEEGPRQDAREVRKARARCGSFATRSRA